MFCLSYKNRDKNKELFVGKIIFYFWFPHCDLSWEQNIFTLPVSVYFKFIGNFLEIQRNSQHSIARDPAGTLQC